MRIAVTGHRGLADDVTAFVQAEIRKELNKYATDGHLVGLSCLADGADQIFASLILDLGGDLEAVVPAAEYRDDLPDEAKPDYDELYARASKIHTLDFISSTSTAHMAASELMVRRADRLFAVWDGQPARDFGGTADVVAYAQQRAIPVTVIWPPGVQRQ
jgi:hypothetical protein